jgi:cytochrome c551/c552
VRTTVLIATLILAGCGSAKDAGPTTPDVDANLAMNTMLVQHQCSNCHAADYARVGPAMKDVAAVIGPATPESLARLRKAILEGTKGQWGEAIMPPQHQVSPADADTFAAAILAPSK